MRVRLLLALLAGIPSTSVHAQSLPPIQTPEQAIQQLSLKTDAGRLAALRNLDAACRGRLRHSLREHEAVIGVVKGLLGSESVAVRIATLDVVRCFAVPRIPALLAPSLADPEPSVASHAAEIAAQVPEPKVTELLLDRLEAVQADCADPKAEAKLVERCVWFVYASGATLGPGHDEKLRARLRRIIEPHQSSPHPKVREVASESLSRAGGKKSLEKRER